MLKKLFCVVLLLSVVCVRGNQILLPDSTTLEVEEVEQSSSKEASEQSSSEVKRTKKIDELDTFVEDDEPFDFLDIEELTEQAVEVAAQDTSQSVWVAALIAVGKPIFNIYYNVSSWWEKKKMKRKARREAVRRARSHTKRV